MPAYNLISPAIRGRRALLFPVLAVLLLIESGCDQSNESARNGNKSELAQKSKSKRDTQIFENEPAFTIEYGSKKIDRSKFEESDLKILFIGNSHTRNSPEQLGSLYSILNPEKKILIARSVGGFLVEHAESKHTLDLIRFGKWDYVVLQAQKYSTSGKYVYPTEGAEKLAAEANKMGAKVIMFPEWSRREFPGEYLRVNEIHEVLAQKADNAVVAPIGQTWVAVADKCPELDLLQPDGNHASQTGNFVNACVFYWMIEQQLPTIPKSSDSRQVRELETRIANAVKQALITSDD